MVDQYARAFTQKGRRVSLERRVANSSPRVVENVRARIKDATPEEVAGGVKSTERHVLILAADVPDDFRPLQQGDAVLVDGMRLRFTARPDDQTRRQNEILLAYEGYAAGA